MTNPFLPLSLAATLAAGLTYGVVKSPEQVTQETEAFDLNALKNSATVWMIRDVKTDDICLLEKTRQVTTLTSVVEVDAACDTVIAEGFKVAVWQQDRSGNVTLGDEQGRPVIEFKSNLEGDLIAASQGSNDLLLFPDS